MARVPTDRPAAELARIYTHARRRLEALIGAALERKATGTAAYRQAQLDAVIRVLAQLQDDAIPAAAETVAAAYRMGAQAADAAIGRPTIAFGGVHQDAINVLADNLSSRLNEAATTVGRRTEDALRKVGLQETAAGIAAGDARRDVSRALEKRLFEDGLADAITGKIDIAGRRWPIDTYAEMVARTTTREAVSAGTANRLQEVGLKLITITAHTNSCSICLPYQGKTYALPGTSDDRYPTIDRLPPFHPNCRHVTTPASVAFDDFERELQQAAEPAGVENAGAEPPFNEHAKPSRDRGSGHRFEAQSKAYDLADREADRARRAWQDQEAEAAAAFDKRNKTTQLRREMKAIREALGPDTMKALEELAQGGATWARDRDVLKALLDGDTTLEAVQEQAEREIAAKMSRRDARAEREERGSGFENRSTPCFVCGHFKRRPADICGYCGDDPVTYGGSAAEFNRAYGYDQ